MENKFFSTYAAVADLVLKDGTQINAATPAEDDGCVTIYEIKDALGGNYGTSGLTAVWLECA